MNGSGPRTTLLPPRIDPDALSGRSPNPSVCPFLRVEGAAGALIAPAETPYGGNRCTSPRVAVAVGEAQQELLCLSGAFTMCPLYARGVARLAAPARGRARRRSPVALRLASIVLGVLAASAAGHALAGDADPVPDGAVKAGAASAPAAPGAGSPYAGLERCPDADCYLWVVREGESLARIAHRLGQPITVLLALNPELMASGELRVGDRLRVPPPGV